MASAVAMLAFMGSISRWAVISYTLMIQEPGAGVNRPWPVGWLLLGVGLEVTLNQAGDGYVTGENVETFEQGVIGSNQSNQSIAPSPQQGS
jgi:hypothetical protein